MGITERKQKELLISGNPTELKAGDVVKYNMFIFGDGKRVKITTPDRNSFSSGKDYTFQGELPIESIHDDKLRASIYVKEVQESREYYREELLLKGVDYT